MRVFSLLLSLLFVCCSFSAAVAGNVVKRVKAHGILHCGSIARPGLAGQDSNGRWAGLEVDICRSVATAVLGSPERIDFHAYSSEKDFDAVRKHKDDLYFLTGSEIHGQNLSGMVLAGPTVFVESHGVMVPGSSPVHHISELSGDSVCFYIGSPVEQTLNAYFDGLHLNWFRRPFSEEGEMVDTYTAQNCHALAGEITALAALCTDPEESRLSSRILPETLTDFPIMVATGTDDAQWSSIVAWVIHTLVSAERPETHWSAGGAGAMPVTAPELNLKEGWQQRVLSVVGTYGDIFDRNLGKDSVLKISRGLNENHIHGGLLLSPFIE